MYLLSAAGSQVIIQNINRDFNKIMKKEIEPARRINTKPLKAHIVWRLSSCVALSEERSGEERSVQ